MDFLAMGPSNGYLYIANIPANDGVRFQNHSSSVFRESGLLAQTIAEELLHLVSDWEWRGNDEREPVLNNLRDRGAALVTAMAGNNRDRQVLIDLLSSISHLCVQHDDNLPWEFLYLGNPASPVSLNQFFGARAVIGRGIEEQADRQVDRRRPDRLHGNKGPLADWPEISLSFGYAEDERLGSAKGQTETAVFSALGVATTQLPKLSTAIQHQKQSARQLSDFLEASELLTHFNCHAKPATGKNSGSMYVSQAYPIDGARLDTTRPCKSSIVVLNCCDGHTMRHSVQPTLAKLLAPKVQAVVATTAKIDDRYATRWAHCFYKALCKGLDVAGSILAARQQLLSGPNPDPSALLYAYLGEPQARLRTRPAGS